MLTSGMTRNARVLVLIFTVMAVLLMSAAAFAGDTAVTAQPSHPPAEIFVAKLAELKSKTHAPILLPDTLPKAFSDAKDVVIHATETKYDIELYSTLDYGNAGFEGGFSGDAKPKYGPRDLPDVEPIQLANGIQGYFRSVGCGGSCAPANLWWKIGDVLYQVQVRLRPDTAVQEQKDIVSSVANSAILAGAR